MSRHTKISQGLKNHGAHHNWHVSANTRAALSLALSALLVFTSVPTPALRALAEEVTPQVEVADVTDGQELDDAAQDEETSLEFGDEQDDDESQNAAEGGQDAPAEAEPAGEDVEPAADDETDEEAEPAEEALDEADSEAEDAPAAAAKAPTGPRRAAASISDYEYLGINNPVNMQIDLFDYWITEQNESDRGKDVEGAGFTSSGVVNKGINKDHTLLFHGGSDGAHPQTYAAETFTGMQGEEGKTGFPYNAPSCYWGPVIQGIVKDELAKDSDGNYTYPVLSDNKYYTYKVMNSGATNARAKWVLSSLFYERDNYRPNESLDYLFNPATGTRIRNAETGQMVEQAENSATYVAGKASYPDVNGLLSVDKTGYYIYDSHVLAAKYNQGTNRYVLSQQTAEAPGYWPLDDGHNEHNDYMGMHMKMSFSMPANGEVLNPEGQYEPMTFTFTGDDDVWVFVDGKLVGDAGGIHQPSSLQINFKTGEVNVNRNFEDSYQPKYGTRGGQDSNSPEYVATKYLKDIFKLDGATFPASSYHTIDFFYLERGNNESNLEIRFNMINAGDFSAHKALISNPQESLLHNDFQFELIGLDGKYTRTEVTDPTTNVKSEVTVLKDAGVLALMPNGANTHITEIPKNQVSHGDVSKYWYRDQAQHRWVYRVGAAADGNVNFGNADFNDSTSLGDTYRYIIREVDPEGSAVEKDGRVYYMEATVREDPTTKQKYLQKRYYTDETFTTLAEDVSYANFVNLKGNVPKATPELTVNKDLIKDGQKAAIKKGQFAFEAVDSHGSVVATCEASNSQTNVATATMTLPTLTAVDFNGVRNTTKTYTYTLRERIPEGAADNGDGTFTLGGVTYTLDTTEYKATFTATYTGSAITLSDITYKNADGTDLPSAPTFHNKVPAALTVVKEWKNAEDEEDTASHDLDSVWVQLYKQTREGESDDWSSDMPVGDPVELTKVVNWSHTFKLEDSDTGPNVRYIAREGTKSGDVFTPLEAGKAIMAAKTDQDSTGKPYALDSVTWTDVTANEEGYASVPECGSAKETIANKPLQAAVSLLKVDADSENGKAPIVGVTFKLVEDADYEAGKTPAYDAAKDKEAVTGGLELTTGEGGKLSLPKLDPGAYWLIETKVPEGYLLRDANYPIGIEVGVKDGALNLKLVESKYDTSKTKPELAGPDKDGAYTLTVRNVRAYELPAAGGPGVYPFLLLGAFAATYAARDASDRRKSPTRTQGRHGRLGGL